MSAQRASIFVCNQGELLESATSRKARVYAEVGGYVHEYRLCAGSPTENDPSGRGLMTVIDLR